MAEGGWVSHRRETEGEEAKTTETAKAGKNESLLQNRVSKDGELDRAGEGK